MYKRIRDLREDRDMNQTQIAKILNMSQTGYSKYETGENDLPTAVLIKLARFYDTSIDYILGETNDPRRYPTAARAEHTAFRAAVVLFFRHIGKVMQVELTVIYQFLNYVRQIIFHIFAFGFIARILNIYGTVTQLKGCIVNCILLTDAVAVCHKISGNHAYSVDGRDFLGSVNYGIKQ